MLVLNEKDMKKTISYAHVMDKVEEAYRIFQSGNFYMPDRPVVTHKKNTLLYMPCFMAGCFGTKFLTLFPENPDKGYPYIDGLMLLNDPENGKTLAILDARYLTALRTGAVGGVGMRNFSRADCKSVGIIGAGQQGFFQAIYAAQVKDIQNIYLFDTGQKNLNGYAERLRQELTEKVPDIHICGTVEELLEKSEIVVTATPAVSPVVPDNVDLLRGKCFIAIGSYKPEMRELPNAIWKLVENVYTELPFAMEESGDLSQPLADGFLREDQVKYIGDWLNQEQRPLPSKGETRYFKSVGLGLLDLNVAQLIYNEAIKMNMGQIVEF
jgi:ornithine cyclodeaminase/alanine dehydrogenase-like protein (mu-crystallin family)